eukprot:scaffold76771_cov31-Tisochrysis_lutea.AAC.2
MADRPQSAKEPRNGLEVEAGGGGHVSHPRSALYFDNDSITDRPTDPRSVVQVPFPFPSRFLLACSLSRLLC